MGLINIFNNIYEMKKLLFLVVSFILCTTTILLSSGPLLLVESKCAMRRACRTSKKHTLNEWNNPFDESWLNCKYDGEPRPLATQQGRDDFKLLCAPMFESADQPLCCDSTQLANMKNNLQTAEAVGIGACSACYFNFRML